VCVLKEEKCRWEKDEQHKLIDELIRGDCKEMEKSVREQANNNKKCWMILQAAKRSEDDIASSEFPRKKAARRPTWRMKGKAAVG
jgi:hypothetical protein